MPTNSSHSSSPRQVLLILAAIWLALMLYNALTQISGLLTIRDYQTNFFAALRILTTSVWLPWVIVAPIVVYLGRRFPIQPQRWLAPLFFHIGSLLLLSVLIGVTLGVLYHYSDKITESMKTYEPWQHAGHYLFGDRLFLFNVIIYTIFIATFNIQSFYALAVQKARDSAELSTKLKEAQLQALKAQVNPHFLFNTLNSIAVLILKKDNDKAGEMIRRLGNFFRANIEESSAHWVPLSRELDTVSQYLAIEEVRFADRLTVVTDYDEAAMQVQVPPLILQPLVENAIRHGVSQCEKACQVSITTQIAEDTLKITLKDNAAGCDFNAATFSKGLGLTNVKNRLTQSYGENYLFEQHGKIGEGVTIVLTLPIHTANL